MRHRKVWLIGIGVLAVAGGLVAAGLYALARAPTWIEGALERTTGREVRLQATAIDWSWTPVVRLRGLEIANADWGEAPHLLKVRELRASIRIPPLLRGRVELPEIRIDGASVAVEQRPDGTSNWSFLGGPGASAAAEGAKPDERSEFPSVGQLRITDSSLMVRLPKRELSLDGQVSTAIGKAEGTEQLELALEGRLADKPLSVRLTGGSVVMLQESKEPYPVEFVVEFAETRLTLDGRFRDPVSFEGADVRMGLEGPNLAEVFPLLGIPAPPSPPYALEGQLQRDGQLWRFHRMSGHVGESDMAGDVTIDYRSETPRLEARLVSDRLRFADLAPLVGVAPDGQKIEDGKLFPDEPLNVERLRSMDMDVELVSEHVEAQDFLPVRSLHARVRLENGRAEANPLKFGVAGGIVQGEMALNARSGTPSADAELRVEGVRLSEFFKGTDFYDTMGGEVQGRLYLLGSGRSLAEIMGTARGNAALAMTGGAISGLLIEGAGVDLSEALVLVVGEDSKVPIRCAVARLQVEDGRAAIERAIMDTTDSVLYVRGGMNLRKQTLSLDIEAQAKDFSLLDVDAPVHIEGPITDPAFSLGDGAPIPFIELGEGEDVPCDKVIEDYLRPPQDQGDSEQPQRR